MQHRIKQFFIEIWRRIEEHQMARAQAALKSNAWSRIE